MKPVPPFPPSPTRWRLGFKPAVLEAFAFLESYGFHVVRAEEIFVRFESPAIFVNVHHDRVSCELGVWIGQLGQTDSFHIGTVARFITGREDRNFGGGIATTQPLVEKFVRQMAEWTREYAIQFLQGDPQQFHELWLYVAKANAAFLKKERLDRARAAADQARIAEDWAGVVKAYEPIAKEDLSSVERKRLAYARKRAGTETAEGGRHR